MPAHETKNTPPLADIPLPHPVLLPKGDSKLGVKFMINGQAKIRFALTTRVFD